MLKFDSSHKLVLTAAIDPAQLVVGLADSVGQVIDRRMREIREADGPEVVLPSRSRTSGSDIRTAAHPVIAKQIGVAVPAPVEHVTGRPIEQTIMPGWHDCPIREKLEETFALPVYVDNDANAMALGEYRSLQEAVENMLYVRASDGIGARLELDSKLYRGTGGAAGALGHLPVYDSTAPCT